MDIAIFEADELPLVLGALRTVALANDVFTDAESALIEGLAELHGQRLRAAELPRVSGTELARVLTDAHRRKRAVQLAIIVSLVEGQPSEQTSRSVLALAQALDVREEALRVLDKIAHEHAMLVRFDMVRRVQRFATHASGTSFVKLALPTLLGLGQNPELAARYYALAKCPEGSLGRALFLHFYRNDFAMPGERGGLPELMLFHDVGHVVSGYGVDPQGEIQQAAFQAGFARTDGFVFLLFGILQFHLGVRITPVAKGQHGLFDVRNVLQALARGAACKVDFSEQFDVFQYANEPLDELRARWGVPALGVQGTHTEPDSHSRAPA
jgi:hypothetical protein